MQTREHYVRRFREDLDQLGLPGAARGILVAGSGGPDSTLLCHLFAAAREGSPGWPPLWLGHVHHGIRGADADRDAEFARALAERLGWRFLLARVDAPGLVRSRRLSPEAAARAARYGAFQAWTGENPIDVVALGHTKSDQSETVLLRLFRKAGLRGLAGMPPSRPLVSGQRGRFPRLVRPLLGWTREEVLELLSLWGQEYREDLTNRDLSILRNRIRHRLLPLLKAEFEPGIEDALHSAAGFHRCALLDLESLAEEALAGALRGRSPASVEIDARALARLPSTVRRFTIEKAYLEWRAELGADRSAPVPYERLGLLLDWIAEAPVGPKVLDLGGGLRAELRPGTLVFRAEGRGVLEPPPAGVALLLPGRARWGGWEIRAELAPANPPLPAAREAHSPQVEPLGEAVMETVVKPLMETVDRSTLTEPLLVRSRLAGDRLRPLGAPGRKKLKEFFRERGVEPRRRSQVPLVVDARGIVWVVGHRITHSYRLRPESREIVRFSAREVGS